MRFEVAGRCDGGAPVCGRCGSRWARTRSAGGPGSARSRCTAIGRRRRRPGNGGPRAQNCCGRPVARDRASPWPACCGSGWSPITGGDRQQWPVTGRRSVSWPWNRIGSRRAIDVGPAVLAAAITAWRADGWTDPTVWARVRALRSALGWAHVERILDRHPLEGMRGPPQPGVRLHAPVEQVRAILDHAQRQVNAAVPARGAGQPGALRLHRAEQVLLLTRLAADSGARRGELASLQLGDLDGDILTIARATSNEVVGPTKSGLIHRLTLGPTTAALWRHTVEQWRHRAGEGQRFGPWLFSRRADHTTRLSTSCLAHRLAELCTETGHPDVTLHRLRHTVATTLVSQGDILQAQYRLRHRDAATTLRIYSHVLPLTDQDAAATLEELYRP